MLLVVMPPLVLNANPDPLIPICKLVPISSCLATLAPPNEVSGAELSNVQSLVRFVWIDPVLTTDAAPIAPVESELVPLLMFPVVVSAPEVESCATVDGVVPAVIKRPLVPF